MPGSRRIRRGATVPVGSDHAKPEDCALVLNRPSLFATIMMGVGVFQPSMGGYLATRMTGG